MIRWMLFSLISTAAYPVFANDNQKCLDEMGRRYAALSARLKSGSIKSVDQSSEGTTLYLNGEITPQMAAEFKRKVAVLGKKIKFVMINSPGGNVAAGLEIADWIFERHNQIKVGVPYGGICASMCTHLLACADDTTADDSVLFMHHPAALSPEGKAQVRRMLGNGSLAALTEQIVSGMSTSLLNNNKCAEAYQSQGARKAAAATTKGLEICFPASKIRTDYPGLIQSIEKTGNGLLDDGTH